MTTKTLLDEFAIAALPISIADYTAHGFAPILEAKAIATYIYQIANAMMKERQKYETIVMGNLDDNKQIYNLTLADLQNLSKNLINIDDLLQKYENILPIDFVMKLDEQLRVALNIIIAIKEKYDN